MKEALLFSKMIYLISEFKSCNLITTILPITNDMIIPGQIMIIAKAFIAMTS